MLRDKTVYVKGIETTFTDYKECGLKIATPSCTFKCCREQGMSDFSCGNYALESSEPIPITITHLLGYFDTRIHKCLIFGGLEPFDTYDDMYNIIDAFVEVYEDCPIIIYSGYMPNEVDYKTRNLKKSFPNTKFIVKYGRYIPNMMPKKDELLGVTLVSGNQFANIL